MKNVECKWATFLESVSKNRTTATVRKTESKSVQTKIKRIRFCFSLAVVGVVSALPIFYARKEKKQIRLLSGMISK
jgi:hypothetical protein